MRQTINLTIPKSWQELPDKELRYVFRLLNGSFTLTQVKTRCLIRWAGLHVLRQEGALFVVRRGKQVFPISALQITEAISNLEWLGDFPVYPVRLSRIGFHRAVNADLQNVSFEDFLTLDNLYQGYLQTQKENLLHDMALILYQYKQLQDNVNTQIRALTGGDITKERDVLRMDCWRALTELDAKAKDYDELQKATKK